MSPRGTNPFMKFQTSSPRKYMLVRPSLSTRNEQSHSAMAKRMMETREAS